MQAWLRARVRLTRDLLAQSPPWIRGIYEHSWAPVQALGLQIQDLPQTLWSLLLNSSGGWVIISKATSCYTPGPATIRHQRVHNLVTVSVEDLAEGNERPLHVIGHLIDHYLGNEGGEAGTWLSEGGGRSRQWREAGGRLARLFDLGYGIDEVARSSPKDYFAQSLAIYCRERQRLNIADPQVYKWFRSTLWNEAFWKPDRQKGE